MLDLNKANSPSVFFLNVLIKVRVSPVITLQCRFKFWSKHLDILVFFYYQVLLREIPKLEF